MKLRILNNSIRLRLSQSEVKRIADHEPVIVTTHFPNQQTLTYHLTETTTENPEALFENNTIHIRIPALQLHNWATTNEVGIQTSISTGDKTTLSILIEKDFRCLTDRPNEDEQDLFPHPTDNPKC